MLVVNSHENKNQTKNYHSSYYGAYVPGRAHHPWRIRPILLPLVGM